MNSFWAKMWEGMLTFVALFLSAIKHVCPERVGSCFVLGMKNWAKLEYNTHPHHTITRGADCVFVTQGNSDFPQVKDCTYEL